MPAVVDASSADAPTLTRLEDCMGLLKLEPGEACANYSSDFADWDSAYLVNLDHVTLLEEREHKYKTGNTTSWFVRIGSIDLEVTQAAFDRIRLALEAR